MIYNGIDLTEYPICDADIWIDVVLAGLDTDLLGKYQRLIAADVVEKEILKFKKNNHFKTIAEKFLTYKVDKKIIVINHSDIEEEDRKFLEKQLVECDNRFETGLADTPHEKHKGEIVSAIYAGYFEIPFLKSNDGTFKEGNMGRIAFPNLIVKNRKDMLKDLVSDKIRRREIHQLIKDTRKIMDEEKRIYEERKKVPPTDRQIQELLRKLRSGS